METIVSAARGISALLMEMPNCAKASKRRKLRLSLFAIECALYMSTLLANLSEIVKGVPPGAWAAISELDQRVIACGTDMQAVLQEAREKGESVPLMVKIPERPEMLFFPCSVNAAIYL
jgi:hypothetical protein